LIYQESSLLASEDRINANNQENWKVKYDGLTGAQIQEKLVELDRQLFTMDRDSKINRYHWGLGAWRTYRSDAAGASTARKLNEIEDEMIYIQSLLNK
jgi:hypothetical protein